MRVKYFVTTKLSFCLSMLCMALVTATAHSATTAQSTHSAKSMHSTAHSAESMSMHSAQSAHSTAETAHPAEADQVVIKDFMFSPMSLTVKAGTTVNWLNKDEEPHTVVSDTGLFRSNALDTNDKFSFKFDKPGTYNFTCSIHPKMVGTIVVQ